MVIAFLLLIASGIGIYFASEFFVNGIEWVGRRLHVSQNATGTILAAFGTALPESIVALVAMVFDADPAQKDIGVGAALGGPLALSTIAYGVVGLALLGSRPLHVAARRTLNVDFRRLGQDQTWFLAIFACKVVLGVLAFPGKQWLGLLFLVAYGLYLRREIRLPAEDEQDAPPPLFFRRADPDPSLVWALIQTGLALAIVFVASHTFVTELSVVAPALGLPPQLLALLLTPVATELPEVMNAVIWVRQGKERLALANISGAMMIQATIPTALGLYFTAWRFQPPTLLAGLVTGAAILFLLLMFRSGRVTPARLALASLVYLLFAGLVFVI